MPTFYRQAVEFDVDEYDRVPVSPYLKELPVEKKLELVKALKTDKKEAKLLKFHNSLCPECVVKGKFGRMKIPALTYRKGNEVWTVKVCPKHGPFKEVYWEDFDLYQKAERFQDKGIKLEPQVKKRLEEISCPADCGLCAAHESHTGLGNIVATNRCDLSCYYCFFYAKEGEPIYEPSLGQIRVMLEKLRNQKPIACNAVQITGGEPSLRDDIIDIIKLAREVGFEHIQLNTNGIRLANEPGFARKVKEAGSHVLYLSFDGLGPRSNIKNYWEIPDAITNCRKAGLGVVLVPTVIRGVNDHEVGDMIRFAAGNIDTVRSVNFQPVSFVGRMPEKKRKKERITIPGTIKRIEEQTSGQIRMEDFYPIPFAKYITDFIEAVKGSQKYRLSTHFACGMATYVFRDGRKLVPLTRFFDVEGFAEYLDALTGEIRERKPGKLRKYWLLMKAARNIGRFVDKEKKPEGLNFTGMLARAFTGGDYRGLGAFHHNSLFIGMMHFQDPYNYDTDRVHKCCIHYATPDGRLIPFCAFNVIPNLYRDRIQKQFSMTIKQWERKSGKKFGEDKYKRRLTKEKRQNAEEFYRRSLKMEPPKLEAAGEAGAGEANPVKKVETVEGRKKEEKAKKTPRPKKTKVKDNPIGKKTLIGDLLREHPEAARFLFEKGIHCVGCAVAGMETLEQGLKGHGYSDKQVDETVEELKKLIRKE